MRLHVRVKRTNADADMGGRRGTIEQSHGSRPHRASARMYAQPATRMSEAAMAPT